MTGKTGMIKGTLRVFWRMAREDLDAMDNRLLVFGSYAGALLIVFLAYWFIFMPMTQVI